MSPADPPRPTASRSTNTSTLETCIDIAASAERTWDVLTDFPAYPGWNPFIIMIEGKLKPGASLVLKLSLPGKPAMTFKPQLTTVNPPRELRWVGQVLAPGLLDGAHGFEIESTGPDRCRLHHVEDFSGVLLPLFIPALQEATRGGFEAMNRALKARAERI
ncbi:MAG: SRPBCC domain-containing protein [Rhodospirillaceae bacterium]